MKRIHDAIGRAQAGDDDRHLMFGAYGKVGFQPLIGAMDDQVDGVWCDAAFRIAPAVIQLRNDRALDETPSRFEHCETMAHQADRGRKTQAPASGSRSDTPAATSNNTAALPKAIQWVPNCS